MTKGTVSDTYWDDGNTINADGCNSTCAVELGWTWSGGGPSSASTCADLCGDNKVIIRPNSSYCDDNNNVDGDGWSALWAVETGFYWGSGTPTTPDVCYDSWQDGIVAYRITPNYWDDGNNLSGDGWTSNWFTEPGWTWSGGSLSSADTCIDTWGDGIVAFRSSLDYCDDQNTLSNDGWSSSWITESGWTCAGGHTSNKDTCTDTCGDGRVIVRAASNYWDDSNTVGFDGCNFNCQIESGWSWTGGTASTPDTCTDIWGDGNVVVRSSSNYCDDGNTVSSDGCSSSCILEYGYTWSGGTSSTPDYCSIRCGDSMVAGTESWDDGNNFSNDGCNNVCGLEAGFSCTTNIANTPATSWASIWGDGLRVGLEEWDDQNTISGDGCSNTWAIESGWSCLGGSLSSRDTCSEICGDGKVIIRSPSTHWDDQNTVVNDGWDANCITETGWSWTGGSASTKDTCIDIWGDGKVMRRSTSNYCDDTNTIDNDGCSSECLTETGWTCSGGNISTQDTCTDIWGDGMVVVRSASNYWDDSNLVSSDGWSSSWMTEAGWTWTGGDPSTADICNDLCGDGTVVLRSSSNYCDDSNTADGDGWSFSCQTETGWSCTGGTLSSDDTCIDIWGDGLVAERATSDYWDDGNLLDGDGWSSLWAIEFSFGCDGGSLLSSDIWYKLWGEGRIDLGEEWDDGNPDSLDGCSDLCIIEIEFSCTTNNANTPATSCQSICGDGLKTFSDEWDDGNTISGDGWSNKCKIEDGFICQGGSLTSKDIWDTECNVKGTNCPVTAVKTASTVSVATAAGAAGIVGIASLFSGSSPLTIWVITAQLRLFSLLLLTGGQIPESIIYLISNNNIIPVSYKLETIEKTAHYDGAIEYLNFKQSNQNITDMGLESGSSFVNSLGTCYFLKLILLLNVAGFFILKYFKKDTPNQKLFQICLQKMERFFYSTVYIRIILESFQFSLLSSFSEIYDFNISSHARKLSTGFAWTLLFGLFLFLIWVYSICCGSSNSEENPQTTKHDEIFVGVKKSGVSKYFVAANLIRLLAWIVFLIASQSTNQTYKTWGLVFIQIWYLLFIVIVRPFIFGKDNVIGILNESIFLVIMIDRFIHFDSDLFYKTVLAASLVYLSTGEKWNSFFTNTFSMIITSNSMLILIIVLLDILVKCLRKWCKKRPRARIQPRVNNISIVTNERIRKPVEEEKVEFDYTTFDAKADPSFPKRYGRK